MTPREWHLLLDGHMESEKDKARWLAPIVSASAGNLFTASQVAMAAGKMAVAAQLLMDEDAGETESEAARMGRAERNRKALMRKIERRRKRTGGKQCQA